jgi:hypothetical protein
VFSGELTIIWCGLDIHFHYIKLVIMHATELFKPWRHRPTWWTPLSPKIDEDGFLVL